MAPAMALDGVLGCLDSLDTWETQTRSSRGYLRDKRANSTSHLAAAHHARHRQLLRSQLCRRC